MLGVRLAGDHLYAVHLAVACDVFSDEMPWMRSGT